MSRLERIRSLARGLLSEKQNGQHKLMEDTEMRYGGDYDDAVSVIDVWLQEHPERRPWEREEFDLPMDRELDLDGLTPLKKPEKVSRYSYV